MGKIRGWEQKVMPQYTPPFKMHDRPVSQGLAWILFFWRPQQPFRHDTTA